MKKFCGLISAMLIFVLFCSCAQEQNKSKEHDAQVHTALEEIQKHWKSVYDSSPDTEPYLEVKNTRLIFLKEDADEFLENADFIVEFILFSNYMNSAPYYENAGIHDSVVFYKDGSAEVLMNNPFQRHRSITYDSDFSSIIESIEDCGSSYDKVLEIK